MLYMLRLYSNASCVLILGYLLKLTVKGQKMSQSHTATCYVQSPTFECRFLFNGVNKSKDILQVSYDDNKLVHMYVVQFSLCKITSTDT